MGARLAIGLFLCAAVSPLQAQRPAPIPAPAPKPAIVPLRPDLMESIVTRLDLYERNRFEQFEARREALEASVDQMTNFTDVKTLLDRQTKLFDDVARFTAGSDDELVGRRYDAGKSVITEIQGAINTINMIHKGMKLEGDIGLSTNLWADQNFRSTWDYISDWGTIAGSAVATYFLASGESKRAGIGVGITSLTKFLGSLKGSQTGEKVESKAAFIDLSRRAYDDMRARNDLLKSLIAKNTQTLTRLAEFKTKYDQANTTQLKRDGLTELDSYVLNLDLALDQVLTVLEEYKVVVASYKNSKVTDEVKRQLATAEENIADMESNYRDEVRKFLALSPELRQKLTGAPTT